ncbi:hypothetical protein JCM3766R1_000385 [Sporobolomyces carnicolor]
MSSPQTASDSSPRGLKRPRTRSASPRTRKRSSSQRDNTHAAEGVNSLLIGSSRDLEASSRGSSGEPTTEEEEDEDDDEHGQEASTSTRRITPREGVFTMSFPGEEENVESEGEPATEPSEDEEPSVTDSHPNGRDRLSVPSSSPAILDLTDEGDEDDADTRGGLLNRNSSDEIVIVSPVPSTSGATGGGSRPDSKGKTKRRRSVPTPSPSPSTQPPPSNDAASSNSHLASLATLSCPICLGPPTPLALTACGHAFCAPCLHAALVAGPALTPPPAPVPVRGRGGARARGRARGRGGSRGRGRGTGARGRGNTRASGPGLGAQWESDDYEDEEGDPASLASLDDAAGGDPDLNKHCPVCRTPLYGGWGKSLRGLMIRMAPVKRN